MSAPISRLEIDPLPTEAAISPDPMAPVAVPQVAPATDTHALGAWLELTCRMIPGVAQAFAGVVDSAHEAFAETATWPPGATIDAQAESIARSVLDNVKTTQITTAEDPQLIYLARCMRPTPTRTVALVLKLPQPTEGQRDPLYKLIDWVEAWLGVLTEATGEPLTHSDLVLDVMNAGLGADDLHSAATAISIRLSDAARSVSVNIGVVKKHGIELLARSQTASFDPRTRANRAIVAAMEEALDEQTHIIVPGVCDNAPVVATRAHDAVRTAESMTCVYTLLLKDGDTTFGALTLMRKRGGVYSQTRRMMLEAAADAAARVLNYKRAAEMPLYEQVIQNLATRARVLAGPGRWGTKIATGILALLVALLLFVDGTYRVTAPATLEGVLNVRSSRRLKVTSPRRQRVPAMPYVRAICLP